MWPNQKGKNVRCVYVLIGQKRSTVVSTIELFKKHAAMSYTTVVVAEANTLPGLQHLAPFAIHQPVRRFDFLDGKERFLRLVVSPPACVPDGVPPRSGRAGGPVP